VDHRPCGGRRLSSGRTDAHFTAEGGRWWSSCSSYAPSLAKVDNRATHPFYPSSPSFPSSHLMYLPHHRIRLLFLPSPPTSFPSLHPPLSVLFLPTFSLVKPHVRHPTSFCYVLFSLFFPSLSQLPRIASSHQHDDPHAPLFYADLVLFSTWYTRGSMSVEGGEARPLFFLHPAPSIRASDSRWSSETTQQRVHPSNLLSLSLPSIGRTEMIKNAEQRKERYVA